MKTSADQTSVPRYQTFWAFYPFYLSQHQNQTCRRLHVIGSTLVLALLAFVLTTQSWRYLFLLPVLGYGFAWVGHFFFEHNKPATFIYPVYSLMGDWVMYWQTLTGKLRF
ncbi:MAG: DUF962 domain-containing protein [Aquabacterium sp.]|nr:DUF962 domain-containing protein [Aquabacterium sp.]